MKGDYTVDVQTRGLLVEIILVKTTNISKYIRVSGDGGNKAVMDVFRTDS